MTLERRKILNAFGAKIIFSQGSKGMDGAENLARKIVMQNPNKYFMSYQFTNTSNILTHYETTAEEIWKDYTFYCWNWNYRNSYGVSKRLKEYNTFIQIIRVQPKIGEKI
jgi:cysteine synthase B